MEIGEITCYRRYVGEIIIIFNQNSINEDSLTNYMKNMHKYLKFKVTEEENSNINYFDLSPHRHNHNLQLEFKKTHTKRYYYIFHIQSSIKTQIRRM
jgi:hypothetical protein